MATIEIKNAYKSNPVPNHLEHVDFNTAKELPDAYEWIPLDVDKLPEDTEETVPIIDLSAEQNMAELVSEACRTWGVFQVINHGIPQRVLDGIVSAASSLFSLPIEQKLKVARSPDALTGYGQAPVTGLYPKPTWSEGFTMIGTPVEHAEKLWPEDHTVFCDKVDEFHKEMNQLATRVSGLVFGSLGLNKGDIDWADPEKVFNGASIILQMNYYPSCPAPDRAMGLPAHTDSTLFTILHQSDTTGLQVLRDDKKWHTVPPVPGALVVFVGDLLHILSNGVFPSGIHRAILNKEKSRFSFGYFLGPPSTAQVAPYKRLLGPKNPPMYRSVTWKEYLGFKSKNRTKEALALIRLRDGSAAGRADDNAEAGEK